MTQESTVQCPYCHADLTGRPILCKNCGHEVRLALSLLKRIERLRQQIKNGGQVVSVPVPEVKEPKKFPLLLVTIIFYVYTTVSSIILLRSFSFLEGVHVYEANLIIAGAIYAGIACYRTENLNVWLPLLFAAVAPEIMYQLMNALDLIDLPTVEDVSLFFTSISSIIPLLAFSVFITATVILSFYRKIEIGVAFGLKPVVTWTTNTVGLGEKVMNSVAALSGIAGAILTIIKNYF